ncbi:MAG: hypothetical protein HFG80_10165 [Eubacterium sp.]|nr:hypothetical protein [Eubacterium sp.]
MKANAQSYKRLALNKLRLRKTETIPTEIALQEISPVNWSKEVIDGEKKIHITGTNEK